VIKVSNKQFLPDDYYIGAPINSTSRLSLFRPSQPSNLTFPEIGMIFYHPYWVKHILYSIEKGYKVLFKDSTRDERFSYFFLPEVKESYKDPENSDKDKLIIRAKDSMFSALMIHGPDKITNTFMFWARDPNHWLFENAQWFKDLHAKIYSWNNKNRDKVFQDIIPIIGSGLISNLHNNEVDIEEEFKTLFLDKVIDFSDHEEVIAHLSIFFNNIVMKSGFHRENVIETSIAFVESIFFPENISPSNYIKDLSNKDFYGFSGFSENEKTSFFRALKESEKGLVVLESIILTDIMNIFNNGIRDELLSHKDSYKKLKDNEDYVKSFLKDIYRQIFPDINTLFDSLLIRSLGWEWNIFLLSGEHITKDYFFKDLKSDDGLLLSVLSEAIYKGDEMDDGILKDIFNYFVDFIKSFDAYKLKLFMKLIKKSEGLISFGSLNCMEVFHKLISNHARPEDIYINILERSQLITCGEDRINIIEDIQVSPPFFAGYASFMDFYEIVRWEINDWSK